MTDGAKQSNAAKTTFFVSMGIFMMNSVSAAIIADLGVYDHLAEALTFFAGCGFVVMVISGSEWASP